MIEIVWVITTRFQCFYAIHFQTEDVDVVIAHFFTNFDVRAIHRTYGQRTVERHLHVAGTGCFFTCG
ncbi:Uncharacterised protein [Vibrio cholerae]|nr:Uncharacterised protein [Vibrio cholerae]CSB75818.1 Uncharacterised protein [Vibrio cholerae]CSC35346.1 Uncharacterised protein [Vibrio cholerae]